MALLRNPIRRQRTKKKLQFKDGSSFWEEQESKNKMERNGVTKMKTESVDKHLQEKLKDPYFKELYELEEQKLEIVKKIIDYRIKHKLNQTQLAEKIGVSQQHISKIESGEFSSVATLEKILLHLGYTVRLQAVPLSREALNKIEQAIAKKDHQAA